MATESRAIMAAGTGRDVVRAAAWCLGVMAHVCSSALKAYGPDRRTFNAPGPIGKRSSEAFPDAAASGAGAGMLDPPAPRPYLLNKLASPLVCLPDPPAPNTPS